MKVCSRCNIEKQDSDFRAVSKNTDGLRSYCKACDREIGEAWRRKQGIAPIKKKTVYVLPNYKKCSRCNTKKPKSDFRTRWERRQSPPFPYLNNTCKKCDSKIAHENHKKRRQTPDGRKKNQQYAKSAYYKRREKAIERMKEYRSTPEYKEMMREYRKRNKEKIHSQEIITKRRYQEKNKTQVTDKYVAQNLKQSGIHSPNEDEIEIKRIKILTKRLKKKVDEHKTGVSKKCIKCGAQKDITEFWRRRKDSDMRQLKCKDCSSKKAKT